MSESALALATLCIGTYLLYRWIESTEAEYKAERASNRELAERFVAALEKIAESKGATA